MLTATMTLWRREMTHLWRRRSRLVGTLATPLIFWLMLGSGLDRVVTLESGYRLFFLPGVAVMTVLFATIVTAYSVIEDRRSGFLQGVLVTPAPRLGVAAGKVLGGATAAGAQGLAVMMLYPLMSPQAVGAGAMLAAAGLLMLIAVMLTSIGFILAWPMRSATGFHAVLNLVLFPMWFLSGAVFPVNDAPAWLAWPMRFNPLTWPVESLQHALRGEYAAGPLGASALGCIACLLAAGQVARRSGTPE